MAEISYLSLIENGVRAGMSWRVFFLISNRRDCVDTPQYLLLWWQ